MAETPEEKAAREKAEAEAAKAKADADAQALKDQEAAAAKAKADEDAKLGAGGEAALKAERKLRQDAEKRAKAEKERADALEADKLSETEREKKRADDAEAQLAHDRKLLRQANLTQALSTAGVAHAAAAARLLDGVEFDEATHRPTNLDSALEAAKAEYGEDMFRVARRSGANINGSSGGPTGDQGPRLTPEELSAATSQGMVPEEYAFYRDNPSGIYQPAKT